jgi:hypothetical protein
MAEGFASAEILRAGSNLGSHLKQDELALSLRFLLPDQSNRPTSKPPRVNFRTLGVSDSLGQGGRSGWEGPAWDRGTLCPVTGSEDSVDFKPFRHLPRIRSHRAGLLSWLAWLLVRGSVK